jgi:hypothetical protein
VRKPHQRAGRMASSSSLSFLICVYTLVGLPSIGGPAISYDLTVIASTFCGKYK